MAHATRAREMSPQAMTLERVDGVARTHADEVGHALLWLLGLQERRLAALDAIELIGSGLSEQCDLLIGVTASEDARVGRITARDGINKEAALARIRAQRPNEYFEQHCDVTLENNGSREEFLQKVEALLQRVL